MDEHNTNNYNERVPEWLDYNPESKDQQQQQQQQQKEITNDLELWKSTMKKKDGLEESKGFVDNLGQKGMSIKVISFFFFNSFFF